MSVTPHSVRVAAARLIAADNAIAAYCKTNWGRGLQVIVDRYGVDGLPGENDAPYAWLYTDGENELGNVDANTFEFVIEIGAVDKGLRPSYTVDSIRSADANGLVLGGIAAQVETLRDMVLAAVMRGHVGACFNTASRAENSVSGFPLEYAALRMNFTYPETLDSLAVPEPETPETEPATSEETTSSTTEEGDE